MWGNGVRPLKTGGWRKGRKEGQGRSDAVNKVTNYCLRDRDENNRQALRHHESMSLLNIEYFGERKKIKN